jgi:hypothetical protein
LNIKLLASGSEAALKNRGSLNDSLDKLRKEFNQQQRELCLESGAELQSMQKANGRSLFGLGMHSGSNQMPTLTPHMIMPLGAALTSEKK